MGADSARCYDPAPGGNTAAHNADGKKCRETFAWGLRNPFRFAFRPGTSDFYINDVGQGTWEEIDAGAAGADYGWNAREGPCRSGSGATSDCGQPPGMTNPIFAYQHGSAPDNCNSITGGAFVPAGFWPAEYDGAYLFGDYVCGRIFRLVADGAGGFTRQNFVTNVGAVIAMAFGPFAGGQALYYTTFAGGGQLRRVTFSGGANRSPSASAQASPTFGPAPLSVGFSAAGSADPDGDSLTYDWDFGDGSAHAAQAAPQHLYAAGTYTATLTVADGRGGTAGAAVRIDAGNSPPVPQITAPAAELRRLRVRTRWAGVRGREGRADQGVRQPDRPGARHLRRHADQRLQRPERPRHPWAGARPELRDQAVCVCAV
jgi:hypothetical protein